MTSGTMTVVFESGATLTGPVQTSEGRVGVSFGGGAGIFAVREDGITRYPHVKRIRLHPDCYPVEPGLWSDRFGDVWVALPFDGEDRLPGVFRLDDPGFARHVSWSHVGDAYGVDSVAPFTRIDPDRDEPPASMIRRRDGSLWLRGVRLYGGRLWTSVEQLLDLPNHSGLWLDGDGGAWLAVLDRNGALSVRPLGLAGPWADGWRYVLDVDSPGPFTPVDPDADGLPDTVTRHEDGSLWANWIRLYDGRRWTSLEALAGRKDPDGDHAEAGDAHDASDDDSADPGAGLVGVADGRTVTVLFDSGATLTGPAMSVKDNGASIRLDDRDGRWDLIEHGRWLSDTETILTPGSRLPDREGLWTDRYGHAWVTERDRDDDLHVMKLGDTVVFDEWTPMWGLDDDLAAYEPFTPVSPDADPLPDPVTRGEKGSLWACGQCLHDGDQWMTVESANPQGMTVPAEPVPWKPDTGEHGPTVEARSVAFPSVRSFGRLEKDKWLAVKTLEEAGELMEAGKRWLKQPSDLNRTDMLDEYADVLQCLANLAVAYDVTNRDISLAVDRCMERNRKRGRM